MDYHYLWVDENDMDWPERNRRIRRLLALCQKHEIEVRETNLAEGKQYDLAEAIGAGTLTIEEQMERMIKQINHLQSFDAGDAAVECNAPGAPVSHPVSEPVEQEPETPEQEGPEFESDEARKEFIGQNLQLAGVQDGQEAFAGPEILEIDLTNACNCNCVGCWNHSDMMGEDKYKGEMFRRRLPTEMVLSTIDQAAAMGAKMVQLSGAGEPFMHPDIMTVIQRIKSHGLACTIITNATLIDEAKARRLVELGVDNLTISVWAGTPKMYQATHPKMKGKTIKAIGDRLRLIHRLRTEKKQATPHIKIYNVISKINASGITDMVDFALSAHADFIEFTPIDIIPGKTDSLALDQDSRDLIARQLEALPLRDDYLELDPTQGRGDQTGSPESKEFARFIKQDLLDDFFRYELEDITRFDVLCPRKEWRLDVQEDNVNEHALLFYYPKEECEKCPMAHQCPIDRERYAVKVEFLSILGYGAFYRRITSPEAEKGAYDSIVRDLPCLVGWTYARLLTSGDVIPCCKGDEMPMGNLHEMDFLGIWASDSYREFRQKAKTLPKDDCYFEPINCLAACDNLGQNLGTLERLKNLNPAQSKALDGAENDGFPPLKRGRKT
jgi:MoaA/NifB/PqqE/SkfB family radical SAM enzyme